MADKPKKMSNFIGIDDKEKMENYIRSLESDLQRLYTYLDTFPRLFEQTSEPTIQRNTFAFWRDSTTGKIYLKADISGNAKKVELL